MNEIRNFIPGDTETPPDPSRRAVVFGGLLVAGFALLDILACRSIDESMYYYAVIYRNKSGKAYAKFGTANLENHDCPDPPEGEERVPGTCTVSSGPIDREHFREKHKDILNP